MSIGKEPDTDENDDRVRLRIGKDADVRIVENYSFHSSILQQPAAFSATLSGAGGAAAILGKYTPGPDGRVALYIGKYRQFTGELDALDAHGDAHSTTVSLKGRDLMARLHDSDVVAERSFDNATYEELFKAALVAVGQGQKILEISNTANRKIRSGAKVKVFSEPVTADEVKATGTTGGKFKTVVTAKLGESWLDFLTRHFNKLGLFPWCDANGNFVLSRPNGEQAAAYHFFRVRGESRSDANVESVSFTNDTTHRFSHMVIFARNLGRKYGHNHTSGRFDDVEMMQWGINRLRVYRDVNVGSQEDAEFYARRQMAENNRASWKLQYTISGHSAPLIDDLDRRGIVVPDMVARVDDDELGIHENLYIESVEYRSPPRQTVITMMRPHDLVFGENQALESKKKAETYVKKEKQRREHPVVLLERPNVGTNYHRSPVSGAAKPKAPK